MATAEKTETRAEQDTKDKLTAILERYRYACEQDDENRKAASDDWDFLVNKNHWPETERKKRKGRPILTIDKLSVFIHQITNDQRQNRPSIKIRPFDDAADKDTARVLQGLIRHIEYYSRAHIAYDTAYEHSVGAGIGFFRVLSRYKDKSDDQELFIQRITDWKSVRIDPDHQEPDGSDMEYAFIETDMDRKAFVKAYPNADPKDWESNETPMGWISDDRIRVAEYFERTDNGIIWRKLCAGEILEEKPWPGKYIPLLVVYGEEQFVDGKRKYKGLVRGAKDPQRMYNYWASTYTEVVAMAPKAKYIGTAKQFANHEEKWAAANTDNQAFLPYNPDGSAPPPERVGTSEVPAGISQGMLMASDDLKSTTGLFDASLGKQGNETSGRAIMARQKEGDTANFHFIDNLTTSLEHLGRILLDLIPIVYDTARIVRILGNDGREEMVGLNYPPNTLPPPGVDTVVHDLSVGQYDVVVEVGPAYATRRQEASENLMQLIQSIPQIGQVAGDLVVKGLDVEHADEIAQRIRNSLPPQITQEVGPDGKPIQAPPSPELMQAQQQMQAMGQQMQQMQEALQQAQAAAQDKAMERQTKLEEASIKRDTEIAKSQAVVEAARIEQETELRKLSIPMEADAMNTQQVLDQMTRIAQVATQQNSEIVQRLDQMQAQTLQLNTQLIQLLSQPKKVVVERDASGRIAGATACVEGVC